MKFFIDFSNNASLQSAVKKGNIEIVRLLLECDKTEVNAFAILKSKINSILSINYLMKLYINNSIQF